MIANSTSASGAKFPELPKFAGIRRRNAAATYGLAIVMRGRKIVKIG